MTETQLMEKWPGLNKGKLPEYKSYCQWLKKVDSEAFNWASDIIKNASFVRRHYSNSVYCYANCYEPGTDIWIPLDPFPANHYPRYLLKAFLSVWYRSERRQKELDNC